MKQENKKRLLEYVQKDTKPFDGLVKAGKELENMQNARVSGKKFHEMHSKREFYPDHPAIKSVRRKARDMAKKMK